jgi:lipopolysaccharide biosynthesis glycosyltransferase
MAVPALCVATEAARRARGAYDVHIFAEAAELDAAHRAWMARHGIHSQPGLSFPRLHATGATAGRIPPASLIRLLMPALLAERYDRLLYIDVDTEIHGDLAPVFDLDLGGNILAAATARAPKAHCRALGMTAPHRYFNSGVMLIDVARWNAENVGERALQFIERNAAICKLPDEDALNAVIDGRIVVLSLIWNFRADFMRLRRSSELVTPVIRHYDGPHKPWKRFAAGRRLFELEAAHRRYRTFVAGTPWQDWLDRQWAAADLWRNLRHEWRVLLARLAGRPTPGVATRRQHKQHRKRLRARIRETRYADVEQGIAVRDGNRLRLNPAKARP